MLLELIISIIFGTILGIISGLIPGIHPNLISTLTILILPNMQNTNLIMIITTLATMLTTFVFISILPSLLLGIPDPDKTELIRPLQKTILEGKAYKIIKQISLTLFLTTVILILLLPVLIYLINLSKELAKFIPIVLIALTLYGLKEEKNRFLALSIIFLSGVLGITIFSIAELKDPLLPLLSGLFGLSSIITSLQEKIIFKKQHFTNKTEISPEIKNAVIYLPFISICSFIPAISSTQLCSILKSKSYIIKVVIFTLATSLLSFATVYTIQKARTGVAAASLQIIPEINKINIIILIITILISSALSSILLIEISKMILKNLNKINIKLISIVVIIIIIALTIIISGIYGLITLILAASLGILTKKLELNMTYLMSALVIPTLFYFL